MPPIIHLNDAASVLTEWCPDLFTRRFIAKPCAMGLKIQANGPQKAQPNAILEKVFTAITKVVHGFSSLLFPFCHTLVFCAMIEGSFCLASTQMRRGWRACPSSSTGMCGPSSAGSGSGATRRSPALSLDSAKACKANCI